MLTARTADSAIICLAPRAGLEPATKRLTAAYSTIELPGNSIQRVSIVGKRSPVKSPRGGVAARAKRREAEGSGTMSSAPETGRLRVQEAANPAKNKFRMHVRQAITGLKVAANAGRQCS